MLLLAQAVVVLLLVAVLRIAAVLLQFARALLGKQVLLALALLPVTVCTLAFFADAAFLFIATQSPLLFAAIAIRSVSVATVVIGVCTTASIIRMAVIDAPIIVASGGLTASQGAWRLRGAFALLALRGFTLRCFALRGQSRKFALLARAWIDLALRRWFTIAAHLLCDVATRVLAARGRHAFGAVAVGLLGNAWSFVTMTLRLLLADCLLALGLVTFGMLPCLLLADFGLFAALLRRLSRFFPIGTLAAIVLCTGSAGHAQDKGSAQDNRPEALRAGAEFHVHTFAGHPGMLLACVYLAGIAMNGF